MTDYSRSTTYHRNALKVTPGASQTRSKAPGGIHPVSGYPIALTHGMGSLVWDLDGHRYVDLICALGATTLGYNHPKVQRAVLDAVNQGPLLSLPTEIEYRASLKLCELVGCDQVRWVKTGSEAMSAAVKLARAKTGNSRVMVAEHAYHGWHDWFQACHFLEDNGVPHGQSTDIRVFQNNSLESVETLFRDEVNYPYAAIILEPHRNEVTHPSFVQGLREIADREDCALIFDDMIYGFRWHEQGSRGFFGVQPDLTAFGKALGAGYPVACVCGSGDWMEYGGLISSTYGGDRIGLAAAEAVLDLYLKDGASIVKSIWEAGSYLKAAINAASAPDVLVQGFPVHPRLNLQDEAAMAFISAMADEGVLLHDANWNMSITVKEHLTHIISAAKVAAERTITQEAR